MAAETFKQDNKDCHRQPSTRNRFWNIMEPFHVPFRTRLLLFLNSSDSSNSIIDDDLEQFSNLNKSNNNTNKNNINKNNHNNKNNINNNNNNNINNNNYNKISSIQSKCSRTIFWQFFLVLIYIFLYVSTIECSAARQEASSSCTFPTRWEGTWFQSGLFPIHIKGASLSFRGKCIATDGGDKFLMLDDNGCHRCVVIYEKHKNVLQYKENYCKGRETLQHLCEQIPGDAFLFSMFKVDAEPVKCPLKGPFTFTYNRGHGECKSPVSNIESCTEDSRLLLSFQACPDVSGTESTVEELTCLATWKDGNARYLVGLVNALNTHHHSVSNEDRYRCFVYEKIPPGNGGGGSTKDAEYKLAQSGDATCNGLDSAEVGSRIMTLRKAPPADRCDFPKWFKGPRHWHALMGNSGYTFHPSDGSMHITKPSGLMETRALCEQINKQTDSEMQAVVHYTTRCQSGFMCMMFYRRYTHVVELQMGTPAPRLEDACAFDHFDINKLPFITLLANNPELEICPLEGLYTLKGAIGPPYITSRHKRNHSNKNHSHHHHDVGYRRHVTLSFRNSEEIDKNSWHGQNRGLTTRNRRSSNNLSNNNDKDDDIIDDNDDIIDDNDDDDNITKKRRKRNLRKNRSISLNNDKLINLNNTTNSNNNINLNINNNNNDTLRNRRDIPGCLVNYNSNRNLLIGCSLQNIIEVKPQCNDDGEEMYSCHGSWTENQTIFIIAKHIGSQHGVCLSYKPTDSNSAQLIIGDSCYRNGRPLPEHNLIANLTVFGKCSDTSSSSTIKSHSFIVVGLLLTILYYLANR